ncbi:MULTISPECIES: hypothetical protein [Methanobacterium]|uniref:Glycosyltransferase RgtA/B/C/D-like domain-containing protein n=1 Tax=Methanobacterium veterum TaxID=408577 RepID=A0A9E4ZTV9_9EURY|nr:MULTISPECIES: hypothetical protein [Methanobacterium]MCZ3365527.1 hypothetical protein [Methanobacterium veterum]MCZ3373279.1 hypothetical protein [Methanobacterium veterum]
MDKVNHRFILALLIYLILGIATLFLLKDYQYPLNPDAISYICISQKYVSGDFSNAINGYWGPLFSWLLVPFAFFGSKPLQLVYLSEILSFIIGFFTLLGVRLLSYKFEIEEKIRTVLMFLMVVSVIYFWLRSVFADLLLLCVLIYYLNLIFSRKYQNNVIYGVGCGILGAMAYFSKSYALPFFVTSYLLFNFVYYINGISRKEKKKILKNFLLGLIVFFTISGIWIGIISHKYDEFTFGTTGDYNQKLVGPDYQGQHLIYSELLKPPNKAAISAWEDPTFIKMNSWDPLKLWNYQLNLIWENFKDTINIYLSFSFLSIIIIFMAILMYVRQPKDQILRRNILYPLLAIGLYTAGYLLILVEDRYLWIVYILLLLMGSYLLTFLFKNPFFNNKRKNIFLVAFILLFSVTFAVNFVGAINGTPNAEGVYQLSQTLKNEYNVHGNIASNDQWRKSLYIAYFTGSKYYGQTGKNISSSDLEGELKKNNIDFYIVWGISGNSSIPNGYKEVTGGKIPDLKVYSLKSY